MRTFNYSPEKFQLIVGSHEVTGFLKEASFTVRRPEKLVNYTPALRRDGMRVFNPNLHAEIVINLLMGSPSIPVLYNYWDNNQANPGTGDFSLSFIDKNGNNGATIFELSAPVCWIVNEPETVYSSTQEGRSWNLESGNCVWSQSSTYAEAAASNDD